MDAYRRYRIDDQVGYYGSKASSFERALRHTTRISATLLVAASLFGAIAAVDESRRGMWAFLAATVAAISTAIAAYEVAFGFDRFSRQYNETLAALKLADASRPSTADESAVEQHVALIERLLRSEIDSWSRLSSEAALDGLVEPNAQPPRPDPA
jgi:prophage DNA circulation protein